jgi:WhiB family redox-sensing transcriptional regulator
VNADRLDLDSEWMEDAACRGCDPEPWFPQRGGLAGPAQAICAACPVREECLRYAIDNDIKAGVWGGVTARQRRGMK